MPDQLTQSKVRRFLKKAKVILGLVLLVLEIIRKLIDLFR